MSRTSAKARALLQLQRMRDASRDIFRNLDVTARTGKEDGMERAEMLASNRERLLTMLFQSQSELNESVAELKQYNAHKERMDVLHNDIEVREAALRQFGAGLQKVENILCDGMRAVPSRSSGERSNRVEVEVDELLLYSHLISYTTSAKEGWEANTPLVGALPPAPHVGLLAQSRLFPARRPQTSLDKEGKSSLEAGGAAVGSKRLAEEPHVRIWKHGQAGDVDARHSIASAGGDLETNGISSNGADPPNKRQFVINPMQLEGPAKAGSNSMAANHGDADAHFVRPPIVIPEKPAKWRPGDPIAISPER